MPRTGTCADPPAHAAASQGRAGSSPSCCMAVETAASGIWDVLEGTSCPSYPAGSRSHLHPIILISPSPPWTSDSSAGLSSYQPTPSSQPCSGLTLCSPHTYLLRSWGISSAPPLSIPPGSVSPSLLCQRGMRRCDQRLHHIHFLPCILLLFTTF